MCVAVINDHDADDDDIDDAVSTPSVRPQMNTYRVCRRAKPWQPW